MERKVIPESENRLVILYAMGRLGPVTGMQLLRFMADADLMNYITLQLSLSELEQQGHMARRAHPSGELWELTAEGRFALESFERRIPQSRRDRMDRAAEACRERFRQERLAPAESIALADGSACVRLRLLEERASLMDVTLYVSAQQSPTLLEERWHACAQTVYEAVMAALAKDYSPDAAMPDIPDGTLRQTEEGEWLLSLADRAEQPSFSLMLPLPGEHLARWCAANWPDACEALRTLILAQLSLARGHMTADVEVSDKGE